MKKLFILILLLPAGIFAKAQDLDTLQAKLNKLAHTDYEIAPEIDNISLDKYLNSKIPVPVGLTSYSPSYAVAALHVDSIGKVSNARILKSYSAATDKDILEALNSLPKLEPAYYKGHNSDVDLAITIRFGQAVYNDHTIKSICIIHLPIISHNLEDNDQVYVAVQQQPSFPGGNTAFLTFVKQNVIYPAKTKSLKVQGPVYLTFVVRKDGSIDNVVVLRSPDNDLSKEALRLLHICPSFNPGLQNGKAVSCQYTTPIVFKLTDD